MRLQFSKTLVLLCAVALSVTTIIGCKSKPKDADIKAAIETALKADPMSAGTMVDVKDGVATITGECKDAMCKTACETAVAAVKGVKSVVNNCTIAPSIITPPVIAADDPLTAAVKDALKAFPSVNGTVKDGIISLTGKISKMDLQKLMPLLHALKPKNIDRAGLTTN